MAQGRLAPMSRWICCASIVLFASTSAPAADLMEVLRQARRADATYAIARATWAGAQERVPQARAGLLPQASLSASTQYNDRTVRDRNPLSPDIHQTYGSGAATVSLTQPLFRWQNNVAYTQALTQAEYADAQLAVAAQELLLRVSQAYFELLLAQSNVEFAQAQTAAVGFQLKQVVRSFEVGRAAITDRNEAQARHDLATAQEIAVRDEVEVRRAALEQLIGRTAPVLAPLGANFRPVSPEPAGMNDWIELALRQNLQVQLAQRAVEIAAHEIERQRAAHYPTLDAFATASANRSGATTLTETRGDTRTAAAGLQLAVPLFQGGATSSRVREAIAGQDRAAEELENARRLARFGVRQAFIGATSSISQIRALESAVAATESQVVSTRRGNELGVRTNLDVLNAEQQLFNVRRDLAQARHNYVLSSVRLNAAAGALTEAVLENVNRWLEPAR